jgi:hypothetical protein
MQWQCQMPPEAAGATVSGAATTVYRQVGRQRVACSCDNTTWSQHAQQRHGADK